MTKSSYLFTSEAFKPRRVGSGTGPFAKVTDGGENAAEQAKQQAKQQAEELRRAVRARSELIFSELTGMGFTAGSVAMIELLPAVQAAWSQGQLTTADAETLRDMARELSLPAPALKLLESHLGFQAELAFYQRVAKVLALMLRECAPTDAVRARRLITERVNRLSKPRRGSFAGIARWLSRSAEVHRDVEATLALLNDELPSASFAAEAGRRSSAMLSTPDLVRARSTTRGIAA